MLEGTPQEQINCEEGAQPYQAELPPNKLWHPFVIGLPMCYNKLSLLGEGERKGGGGGGAQGFCLAPVSRAEQICRKERQPEGQAQPAA